MPLSAREVAHLCDDEERVRRRGERGNEAGVLSLLQTRRGGRLEELERGRERERESE